MILLLILALSTNKLESPKERTVPRLAPSAVRVRVIEPAPMPPEVPLRTLNPADYPMGNQAAAAVAATNVNLTWNPSPEPFVTGYNVYRGTNSRNYSTQFFTSGTNASYSLIQNATNHFAVTAVGNGESDFSNEVIYKSVAPPPPTTNFGIVTMASSNMVTWKNISTVIVTNSEPFQYFRQQIFKIVP